MSHSTHILLTSGTLITKGSLRKDESLRQKYVEELFCSLLVFLGLPTLTLLLESPD